MDEGQSIREDAASSDAAKLPTLDDLISKLSPFVADPGSFAQRWRNLARGIDGGIREDRAAPIAADSEPRRAMTGPSRNLPRFGHPASFPIQVAAHLETRGAWAGYFRRRA